jgi:hypothetical protein
VIGGAAVGAVGGAISGLLDAVTAILAAGTGTVIEPRSFELVIINGLSGAAGGAILMLTVLFLKEALEASRARKRTGRRWSASGDDRDRATTPRVLELRVVADEGRRKAPPRPRGIPFGEPHAGTRSPAQTWAADPPRGSCLRTSVKSPEKHESYSPVDC